MKLIMHFMFVLISLLQVCNLFVYGSTSNIDRDTTPTNTASLNNSVTSSASSEYSSHNPNYNVDQTTTSLSGIPRGSVSFTNSYVHGTDSGETDTPLAEFPVNKTDETTSYHGSNIPTSQAYDSNITDMNDSSPTPMYTGSTGMAEISPTSPIRRTEDDDEIDDDERPVVTTVRPTTTTVIQTSVSTANYGTTTGQNATSSTKSLPGGISGTQTQSDSESIFIIILIVVCSLGGMLGFVAVLVILHAMHKKRKKQMEVVYRRRHNSVPLERQRSFSNPAYLEHDIDILANRLSSISSNVKGNNNDEIPNTNVSVIGNSDFNYHEICIRESKQLDSPKRKRTNIVSNAYDYLRFKGMKTFGKSNKTNIVENEIREPADDNYHVSGYGVDFYDHIPKGATGNPVTDDQYDHVTKPVSSTSSEGDSSKIRKGNIEYQEMYPPIERDMYTQCPIIGTEPRTSL